MSETALMQACMVGYLERESCQCKNNHEMKGDVGMADQKKQGIV